MRLSTDFTGAKPVTRRPAGAARAAAGPLPLVGASEAVCRARRALERAAARRTPILLSAEAGCAPRAVAEALHAASDHRGAMVALDCGAAEAADLDFDLFGAAPRRPASTDLEPIGRASAVVRAGAGTLYLDNIDELPASSQRRLARLLRDGEGKVTTRQRPMALAFQLVAATSRDVETEVGEGRFRADLLRRFTSGRVTIPALRQRPGDLGAIIDRVLADLGEHGRTFTQAAVTVLAALPWPRNLDELVAVLTATLADAAAVVTQEDVLAHVPIDGAFTRWDLTASLREARRRFERDYIAAVLERHQWRMSDAAAALGIERANLYRKTRQLGIAKVPRAQVS